MKKTIAKYKCMILPVAGLIITLVALAYSVNWEGLR